MGILPMNQISTTAVLSQAFRRCLSVPVRVLYALVRSSN
jgi:hypothetical protein